MAMFRAVVNSVPAISTLTRWSCFPLQGIISSAFGLGQQCRFLLPLLLRMPTTIELIQGGVADSLDLYKPRDDACHAFQDDGGLRSIGALSVQKNHVRKLLVTCVFV